MYYKKTRVTLYLLTLILTFILTPTIFYGGEKTISVKIPVSCTGKNTSETFVYNLSKISSEHQNVKNNTVSLKNGETGYFEVVFDYADTYKFKITQSKGSDQNTTYDDTVYECDIIITEDNSGKLFSETVIYKTGSREKTDKASYINEKKVIRETTPETESKNDKNKDDGIYGKGRNKKGNSEYLGSDREGGTGTGSPAGDIKTGDRSGIEKYIILSVLSLLTILYLIRRREEEWHQRA